MSPQIRTVQQFLRGRLQVRKPTAQGRSLADHARLVKQTLRLTEEARAYAREQSLVLGSEQTEGGRLHAGRDIDPEEAQQLRELHFAGGRRDDIEAQAIALHESEEHEL